MTKEALATKYRPKSFEEVVSQDIIVKILEEQVKSGTFKRVYLFCGPAGCGKTTLARIMAKELNNGLSLPIEIDAASNNGVENVRNIIEESYKKPIVGNYKVYILDEVHMLSNGAWNALLKLLEEPPKTVVFILCTTDPQKIPNTILSRVQRFDFSRIPYNLILERLKDISEKEGIQTSNEVLEYISKLSRGGLRTAISMLDKVSYMSDPSNVELVSSALNYVSYEDLVELAHSLINGFFGSPIKIVESWYMNGNDIKQAMSEFSNFLVDACKLHIFKDCEIPESYHEAILEEELDDLLTLLDWTQKLLYNLKWESNVLQVVEAEILTYGRV